MSKFIYKTILFLGINGIAFFGLFIFSGRDGYRERIMRFTRSESYNVGNVGSREIIPYVYEMREKTGHTKLLLGDSVCNQVYNRYREFNRDICVSATNRAITLAGQYLLAREFVENHDTVTDIYLVVVMGSLSADFDFQYGYQYVVMPFVETDMVKYLEDSTQQRLYDRYGKLFCQKRVVEWIDRSPWNRKVYLNLLLEKDKLLPEKKGQDMEISETAYVYLEKLQELCDEKGICFHLLPGPHPDTQSMHQKEKKMRAEIKAKGLEGKYMDYFNQIVYFPENLFGDGVHFDEDAVDEDFFADLAQSGAVPGVEVK